MEQGFTLWFTGLSGSGKTTLGSNLSQELSARGRRVELLDGDVVRTHLSKGLGFSREDRDTNILRIGWVCEVLSRNGVIAIATAISPYRQTRDQVREHIQNFIEVHVATSLEECMRRDVKGLYAKAIAGEIKEFTGVSDPYEPPLRPEILLQTEGRSPEQSAAEVLQWLELHGYIEAAGVQETLVEVAESSNIPTNHQPNPPHGSAGAAYTEEEEAEVSARLEALGYL
jgi:adenylyl-sulfate kinase